jgi:hypothetical protein
MPRKVDLDNLLRDGKESAALRGHRMGDNVYLSFTCAHANCIDCGMEVYANTLPMPNEIDISGEAVALNCPKESRPVEIDR